MPPAVSKADLQSQIDDLQDTLETIGDKIDEALDPELTREQLIAVVKEIDDMLDEDEDDDDEDDDSDDDDSDDIDS